jgi:hypothetical protein
VSGSRRRQPRLRAEFDDLSGGKPTGERNGSVHAAPDEEIARVRRLISRIKADLDELPEPDRAGVEEAITVVVRV